jgi:predicted small lipoprotein YifL
LYFLWRACGAKSTLFAKELTQCTEKFFLARSLRLCDSASKLSSLHFLCVLCGLLFAACGQKGPPLAPLVYLPSAVSELTVKRIGNDVVLQFKIPATNTDATNPADLDRVEVYAHTGPLPAAADFVRYGTLIKRLDVQQPPRPDMSETETPKSKGQTDTAETLKQGSVATVSEMLTEEHKTPGPRPFARAIPATPIVEQVETPGTVNLPLPIMRYYTIVGVSRSRNRRGAFAGPVGVPLIEPPVAPDGMQVSYTADAISLTWVPSEGRYNVYEVELATPKQAAEPIIPLNPALLTTPSFADARVEFGTERCYVVRAVQMAGIVAIESDGRAPVCVTPVDTFAPAPPRALASVTSENAVSLFWEPNTEKDLGGYFVLRGDASGEKLTRLTPSPIQDTTYRDTSVKTGGSYVYAVVAVDTATPPNVSDPSNRVTEVIR